MKVHVWAGISMRGSTGICIFCGIMKAPLYIGILRQTLIPFIGRFIQIGTGLCRITTPSIRQGDKSKYDGSNVILK